MYANFEGWRITEVHRSKEPCAESCVLIRQYAKECSLGYIHAATEANSTPEIFGPECIECTLAGLARLLSKGGKYSGPWHQWSQKCLGPQTGRKKMEERREEEDKYQKKEGGEKKGEI